MKTSVWVTRQKDRHGRFFPVMRYLFTTPQGKTTVKQRAITVKEANKYGRLEPTFEPSRSQESTDNETYTQEDFIEFVKSSNGNVPVPYILQSISHNIRPLGYAKQSIVYFYTHRCEIVYIGETTNFWSRMEAHSHKDWKFDNIWYWIVPPNKRKRIEYQLIKKFRPRYNKVLYPVKCGVITMSPFTRVHEEQKEVQ